MSSLESHVGRGESPLRRLVARVISDGLITPVFQPIVDTQRARIAGFEALSRPTAASGFHDAGSLFDTAQSAGMLWPLERVSRKAAFEAALDWDPDILLFMNCSPSVFADPRFADEVQSAVVATRGLTPGRVVLEITERSEQEHVEGLARQVVLLKERGFQIAIDDVGAGTSGLNRIMLLRPHWLKLDRDLIEGIEKDRVKQNLIRFLIHFTRLSGVKVIAEGVEQPQELATLMDLGIIHAQGYFLGRPGSRRQDLAPAAKAWLSERLDESRRHRVLAPSVDPIQRLARPAFVADVSTPLADVGTRLRNDQTVPGAVVIDGSRCVGWADRAWVLERCDGDQAGYPIGAILPADSLIVPPTDSIGEVVELIGARPARSAGHPVIIADESGVGGIATVPDILASIAEAARHHHTRTTPVTGMPGRVRADEHLAALMSCAASTLVRHDAAVIDIRNFADYNGAYGYELGDQLLRELCCALHAEIAPIDPTAFVAHLGDDRFFVSARTGLLAGAFTGLVNRFESAATSLGHGSGGSMMSPGVGLRIVFIPEATLRYAEPRELFRAASRVRDSADAHSMNGERIGSLSILHSDDQHPAEIRRSA